jgi:hypothetical protein
MNILLMLAHSIEEYDQTKLLASLGYDVFSIGCYSDLRGDGQRPSLVGLAPDHPELRDACHQKRVEHIERATMIVQTADGPREPVDWAKADLPDAVFEWADVIIVHHFEHTWLWPQWPRLREKRVIWRTVGQSVEHNEQMMAPLRADGLEIVRYSPKERNIPGYAGEDALIRFYKDPAEWHGWTGEDARVANVTQHLRDRDPFTNYGFWEAATEGLPRLPAGPGSEDVGGTGALSYEEMQAYLRRMRVYLYTGTQPASYTLGLIEAMMTGIPVVSIGPEYMTVFPYGPDLFEGRDIALRGGDVITTRRELHNLLAYSDPNPPERQRAIDLFGIDTIGAQWKAYLG